MQVTDRDEANLEWLQVVRMALLEAIRWAMGATSDDRRGDPVPAGSIAWPTLT